MGSFYPKALKSKTQKLHPNNFIEKSDEISAKSFHQTGASKFANSTQEGKKCCQVADPIKIEGNCTVSHEGGKIITPRINLCTAGRGRPIITKKIPPNQMLK